MGWLMKNGDYPYLNGVPVLMEVLTFPYPASVWICSTNNYPTCGLIPENLPLGCFANAAKLRTLRYLGTVAQWQNVKQGEQWRTNAPFEQIACNDGKIILKE